MYFRFADVLGIRMNLIPLRPQTETFTVLFYQHSGKFFRSKERIGNQDQDIATNQFNHFFDVARQKNSDLVLTPEYSCPWAIINNIIDSEQLWPAVGKLWVLGCESIS